MSYTSLTDYYVFLSQFGSIEDIVEAADTDGDGAISKKEMKALLNYDPEFDKYFSEFWKSLDNTKGGKIKGTKVNNTNHLDNSELDKLLRRSEAALAAQNIIEGYDGGDLPDLIRNRTDITYVKALMTANLNMNSIVTKYNPDDASLLEEYIEGLFRDTCLDIFLTNIEEVIFEEVGNAVPDGYHIFGDHDLVSLINKYINSSDAGDADIDDIITNVNAIVRNYFAQAGIGNAPDMTGLEDYTGPASTATKDFSTLQKAQLEAKFTNALNINNLLTFSIPDQYKTQLQDLIDGFIKGVLNGDLALDGHPNRTFEYMMGKGDAWVVQKLKDTEDYKKLEATFKFFDSDNAYANNVQIKGKNVSIGNMFKKWFGLSAITDQSEMNECMQYIMESKTYQNIVAAAYKKYQSGEITSEADLYTEIGKQVMLNLAKIMSEVGQKCEIVEQMLYNSFDAAKKGLFGGSNGDQALGIEFTTDELRTLYNQYIDLLKTWKSQLSDSTQQEKLQKIISELESDTYPGRFLQNIQTAHNMIEDLNLESELPFEAAYSVKGWEGLENPFEISTGINNQEIGQITPLWEEEPGPALTDIAYKNIECKKEGITVTISESGKIKVTVDDNCTAEQARVTFDLTVKGEVVTSNEFLLNIQQTPTVETLPKPSGLSGGILLHKVQYKENDFRSNFPDECMANFETSVLSKLEWDDSYARCGVTKQKWDNARTTLKNYVGALFNAIANFNWDSGSSIGLSETGNVGFGDTTGYFDAELGRNVDFNYSDDNVQARRARSSDYMRTYNDITNKDKGNCTNSKSGIIMGCNYDAWGGNMYYCYINKDIMWQKFVKFLHLD